jgi:hypothetical protein
MIRINNNSYIGSSVTISKGKIIIDGIDVTPDSKKIDIVVDGNISKLNVDSCDSLKVTGDVDTLSTMSGDVDISGNVTGNVKTMSGDVKCENIGGSTSTMSGDIKYRK